MALTIKLDLDEKGYIKGIRQSGKETKKFQGQVDRAGKEIKSSSGSLLGVGAALGGVFAASGLALKGFIHESSKLEDAEVRFGGLLRSAKAGKEHIKDLVDFTAKTPFLFEGVAEASKQLIAFEVPADEVMHRLKNLGDISAATGRPLSSLAVIFGQVSQEGKLTGERLRQLSEAAVPISSALAKTMGVAQSSIKGLVTAGAIDVETFKKAMDSISQEGGLAAGAMIKLSKTLSGVISNVIGNFSILQQRIGERFLPLMKSVGATMVELLDKIMSNPALVDMAAAAVALTLGLSGLGAALVAVKGAMLILAIPSAAIAVSIGGIGLALVAAGAAVYAFRDKIRIGLQKSLAWMRYMMDSMVETAQGLKEKMRSFAEDVVGVNLAQKLFGTQEEIEGEKESAKERYVRAIREIDEAVRGEEIESEERAKEKKKSLMEEAAREQRALQTKLGDERNKIITAFIEDEILARTEANKTVTQGEVNAIRERYAHMTLAQLESMKAQREQVKKLEEEQRALTEEEKILLRAKELDEERAHFEAMMAQGILNEDERRMWETKIQDERKAMRAKNNADLLAMSKKFLTAETKLEKDQAMEAGRILESRHQEDRRKKEEYQNWALNTSKNFGSAMTSLLGRENKAAFYLNKAISLTDIAMDTARGIMKAKANSPLTLGMPWAGIIGATGAAQAAVVLAQRPPKAARAQRGGLVGRAFGTPSTGDFQPVMAEAGELILPRDDVKLSRQASKIIIEREGERERDTFFEDQRPVEVDIMFQGEASSLIEAQRRENLALGIGIT